MVPGLYLSEDEINEFVSELDKNDTGYIQYGDLEAKLDEAHEELVPDPKEYQTREEEQRHAFLRSVMGTKEARISRTDFSNTVKRWNVPSLNPQAQAKAHHEDYMKFMPWGRRFRAYWSVRGREVLFVALVVAMQVAFGTWQLVGYLTIPQYKHAFGWGLIVSKTCAGVLYPTLFFLVLSMSRYLAAMARKHNFASTIVNWDKAHSFHVKIAIVALGFGTLHGIGHLAGTFLYGSGPAQKTAVEEALEPGKDPRSYLGYITSLPGWTGIVALGLFWTLALLGMPAVRRRSYELFQLGHLLMYPIIGLLMAHGASKLFQYPMLGFWLAFPAFLVLFERTVRFCYSFHFIPASLETLDADTVAITVSVPTSRYWEYYAGQYILLKIPQLSRFQWHPFTISTCIGKEMQVHIKKDGDWTAKLHGMARQDGPRQINVCIDGPFGAPAQRFYEFDQSMIIGSGIGITPFSGILTDLQAREERQISIENSPAPSLNEKPSKSRKTCRYRRVDFHWIVKERNHLLWFSDLLNKVSRPGAHSQRLDIRVSTYVTYKRKEVSTHIYRYLLELHRTDEHPESPLTGLLNATQFGRPDLGKIMDEHYESILQYYQEMRDKGTEVKKSRRKVGVFFCGAQNIGFELADRCQVLTLRGREDKSFVEYHFMMEVFG
ncbi:Superoxide-generating NADPH oxidase heavy chain subunit A [Lachnellula suecica]|uniref:Superoxide-generating NADPH oxidase heavy chain subunit A n=1 Tax=Lachnellula suecica TaxID=602035 RepID=A0A8T9CC21_9HELO|nr:Superoxide-generating NADPH oxidase heavy chain subunit A [Lachnellula suecica]